MKGRYGGRRRLAREASLFLSLALCAFFLLLAGGSCARVSIRESSVDEETYLEGAFQSIEIYGVSPHRAFHPIFNISFAGFDRWIFAKIEDDEVYGGIALLITREGVSETPYVVLYPRLDEGLGRGEAYTAGDIESAERELGSSLFDIYRSPDLEFRYQMSDRVLLVEASLTDRAGRSIYVGLKEDPLPTHRYTVLLPLPEGPEDPPALYLMSARNFFFNTVKNTRFKIRMDGQPRRIPKQPGRVEDQRVYQSRYSTELLPVVWNEDFDGEVDPIPLGTGMRHGENVHRDVKNLYAIQYNYGYAEILSVSAEWRDHTVRFSFSPAVPEVASLADGAEVSGEFSFSVDELSGIVAGEYDVRRRGDRVLMSIRPTRGERPIGGEPWIDRYRWDAEMTLLPGNRLRMVSAWKIDRENFEIDLDE